MADAHEALRKDMQQEATQELVDRQGLETLFIVVSRITPAKEDLVIGEGDQAEDYISQLTEEGLLRRRTSERRLSSRLVDFPCDAQSTWEKIDRRLPPYPLSKGPRNRERAL